MTVNDQDLTGLEIDILRLESYRWKQDGAKMQRFRDLHPSVTEVGYYRLLNRLLDDERALRHNPGLVNRLRAARQGHVEASGRPP